MSRQIEQALLGLMPTYGADLPPALVESAGSLLAQSRHKASTLKAEEEVARLYACCHLACDRLKITLDLPPIDPRPPIPPRIYKRLYSHLDNIIPNPSTPRRSASGRVRTPSSKLRTADAESPSPSTRQLPSRGTPTKDQSLEQFRRSSRAGGDAASKSTSRFAEADKPAALQPWTLPVIRFLCNETENKKLIPTMVAGIESIVAPQGRRTTDEWVLGHLTSLLAAVYFFVVMRVKAIKTGETVDREAYIPQRKSILALLDRARSEVSVKAGKDSDSEEEKSWEGWASIRPREFDDAITHVKEQGWLTGDWFKALADVVRTGGDEDEDMAEGEDEAGVLGAVRRADTMFQDKYDYLSEAKRADYKVWKEAMLSKISQLASVEAMEIDS